MTGTPIVSTEDERAVCDVLDAVYDAWAENDPDAFVASYAIDATAVHTGTVMNDRDASRATIATVFAGPFKGSRGIHHVQSIRFVGVDTAIVLSNGSILFAGQAEPAPESRTLDSWVLCKQDGAWRVEAFLNCQESSP